MIKNSNHTPLFWSKCFHLWVCSKGISEHYPPLRWFCSKMSSFSEHCHPKLRCISLFIFMFRSIATHSAPSFAFRSITTQSYSHLFYFCALVLIDNKLMHNYMAGKITEMSTLLSGEILPQLKLRRTITLRNISCKVGLIKYIFNIASFEEDLTNRI